MSQSLIESMTHPVTTGVISVFAGFAGPHAHIATDQAALSEFALRVAVADEVRNRGDDRPILLSRPDFGADGSWNRGEGDDDNGPLSAAGDLDFDYDKLFEGFPSATGVIPDGAAAAAAAGLRLSDPLPRFGLQGPIDAGGPVDATNVTVAPVPTSVLAGMSTLVTLLGIREARRRQRRQRHH